MDLNFLLHIYRTIENSIKTLQNKNSINAERRINKGSTKEGRKNRGPEDVLESCCAVRTNLRNKK